MRLGVSSYSFSRALASGRMSFTDVIDWVADSDADHLEVASLNAELLADPQLVTDIREHAATRGVELANYVIGADFRGEDVAGQVATVKAHLDVAHRLGITRFRHDVVAWAWRDADQAEYETTLAALVPICQDIADHAATLGITTMVENHGFFMNNSERLRRLVYAVDRPNFRMLLDVGNFLCVDEDPLAAVPRSLESAAVVHLKDFLVRDTRPSEGWLTTVAGRSILGAIVGHGDLPVRQLVAIIAASGFDGPVSIEFEGLEDEALAVTTGIANARRAWEEATA
jgi:sugar phosphate isomerase/epimerase